MSAPWIVLVLGWVFLLALTIALVLSRASREREIRREIAADIRALAARARRFRPEGGQFIHGLLTAADIADRTPVDAGYGTQDSSGRVRPAGDYRRTS